MPKYGHPLLLGLFGVTANFCAIAAEFAVDREDDDPSAMGCDDRAASDCSLRGAILAANATTATDVIVLPAGTYTLKVMPDVVDDASTGDLNVTSPIQLRGASSATTIINASGFTGGALRIETGGNLSVSDLAITGASGQAAVHNEGVAIIANVRVTENLAGGIRNNGSAMLDLLSSEVSRNENTNVFGGVINFGDMLIQDTLIEDNHNVCCSGGVANWENMTISSSRIVRNSNDNGDTGGLWSNNNLDVQDTEIAYNEAGTIAGGVYIAGGQATITGSEIHHNSSSSSGGGLYIAAPVSIEDTYVHDNAALGSGGGIYLGTVSGTVTLTRLTVSDNSGTTGGGLYAMGELTIADSTFSGNSADSGDAVATGVGGDVRIASATLATAPGRRVVRVANGSSVELEGSLLQGSCLAGFGDVISSGSNLESPGDSCQLNQNDDIVDAPDPMLSPLSFGPGETPTHVLLTGSPAIDAGTVCGSLDQRGLPRPVDGDGIGGAACDIGAVEVTQGEIPDAIFDDGFGD